VGLPLPVSGAWAVKRIGGPAIAVEGDHGESGGFVGLDRQGQVYAVRDQVLPQPGAKPEAREPGTEQRRHPEAGQPDSDIGRAPTGHGCQVLQWLLAGANVGLLALCRG
jgi:hypothetical protein